MLSSSSRPARSLVRTALVCGLALSLAIPALAPLAPAEAGEGGVRAILAGYARAAGATMAELEAATWTLVTADSRTGVTTVEHVRLDEAIAALGLDGPEAPPAVAEPGTGSHLVAGGVMHSCSDPTRLCYLWEVLADRTADRDGLAATYEGLSAAASGSLPAAKHFPLASGAALRVWGQYLGGVHRANNTAALVDYELDDDYPETIARNIQAFRGLAYDNGDVGTGIAHTDRAVHGVGVGTIRLGFTPWGENLYFSVGTLRAHGAFTFCLTEAASECAAAMAVQPGDLPS